LINLCCWCTKNRRWDVF